MDELPPNADNASEIFPSREQILDKLEELYLARAIIIGLDGSSTQLKIKEKINDDGTIAEIVIQVHHSEKPVNYAFRPLPSADDQPVSKEIWSEYYYVRGASAATDETRVFVIDYDNYYSDPMGIIGQDDLARFEDGEWKILTDNNQQSEA